MSESIIYSVLSIFGISLVSLIGIFTVSFSEKTLEKMLIYMISFAAGGLLGDAFIHLLPESIAQDGFSLSISVYILIGIAFSFIIEKLIHWRHCHHPTTHDHPHPFALMNLFGDGVHNFIDGLIIGAAYLVSIPVGAATTIAVLLHEVPQEIGDFGVLIHGGMSKKKALIMNFLTALSAFLGLGVALAIGSQVEGLTSFLLPFAMGSFIYIAVADLIPEMHKEVCTSRSLLQFTFFILGISLMFLMLFIPGHDEMHEHEEGHVEHIEVVEL